MKTANKFSLKEFNGINRNAPIFGWTPQAELWNGRWALIGLVVYVLCDLVDKSVLRDIFHLLVYLPNI